MNEVQTMEKYKAQQTELVNNQIENLEQLGQLVLDLESKYKDVEIKLYDAENKLIDSH